MLEVWSASSILPRMRRCVVVDDDEVTRELAVLFAAEAGWEAASVASGEELLEQPGPGAPDAVLADLHMPGLHGPALAAALRQRFGPVTRLLCTSAARAEPSAWAGFDDFLPKPFTVDALRAALEADAAPPAAGVLNEAIYAHLARSMPAPQLRELYELCLRDAELRIEQMRALEAAGDRSGYQRVAHALRGGCGMVGAQELAVMAEMMEIEGPPLRGTAISLDAFLHAVARLRDTLWSQGE